MPNQTTASRLQDCKDQLEQAQLDAERSKGLTEEVARLRAEADNAKLVVEPGVNAAERRRLKELLLEAETQRDSWTRRAVAAENALKHKTAVLYEIQSLIAGKECLLPQIDRLLKTL